MKKYNKYKPTGIEWIGYIPEHWEIKKIKYNTYVKARVGWHGLKSDEFFFEGDGAYCITGTDFNKGKINWKTCYKVAYERYDEDPYIQLKENDLLITKDGTIGKVSVVKGLNGKATLNSGVFVVRPLNADYTTDYMYWALQAPVFTEFVNFTSKGSTIIHLYQDTFINLPFVLPPLLEQVAIAAYLDDKTAKIDTLIRNKQKLIELLKEEKAALINEAVTKGINPHVPLKPSGIEWLGNIPAHWDVKKLKYVAKSVQTGSTPPSEKSEYFEHGLFNWFTPGDFNDGLKLKQSKRKITALAIDDQIVKVYPSKAILMVGIGATLGKIGICEEASSSNQQINAIIFNDSIDPYFGLYYLHAKAENIVSLANAATLAILNQSQTKDLPIICPSLEEQISIVQHIEGETARIDYTISRIEKEIALMQEYRAALISEVVTGQVKVVD